MISTFRSIAVVAVLAGAALAHPVAYAQGDVGFASAYSKKTPHCTVDAADTGSVVLGSTPQRCFPTYADLLRSLGYTDVDPGVSATDTNLGGGDFTTQAQIIQAVVIDYGPSPDYTVTLTAAQSCNVSITFDSVLDNRFDGIDHRSCNRAEHHYFACDSSPDFVTIGPESGFQSYPSTHQNKEDCIYFKVS